MCVDAPQLRERQSQLVWQGLPAAYVGGQAWCFAGTQHGLGGAAEFQLATGQASAPLVSTGFELSGQMVSAVTIGVPLTHSHVHELPPAPWMTSPVEPGGASGGLCGKTALVRFAPLRLVPDRLAQHPAHRDCAVSRAGGKPLAAREPDAQGQKIGRAHV